ncbi:GreA/GreB family elongation factor [Nocardia sp. NPDC050413]|uniref:GreA/GreB family elongation factor n=1 Tax=Nocardia sp. NPDC050413 TaxID=3155784 RepID=UPI0033C701E5
MSTSERDLPILTLRNMETGEMFGYHIVPDEAADIARGQYPESADLSQKLIGKTTGAIVTSTFRGQSITVEVIGHGARVIGVEDA